MTGKQLAEYRMSMDLSQEDFAKAIKISRGYLSQLEAKKDEDIPEKLLFKVSTSKMPGNKQAIFNFLNDDDTEAVLGQFNRPDRWDPMSPTPIVAEDSTVEYPSRRPARAARPPAPTRQRSSHLAHIIALLSRSLEDLPAANYDLFPVEGTSMIPTVCEGDELLCKQVTMDEIIDGRVYVLVLNKPELNEYRESGVWVKRVYHRKQNSYLTCKSDNKETTDPYFTFKVRADEVQEVWYIVRRFTAVLADPNRDIYERLDELEARLEMLEADSGME